LQYLRLSTVISLVKMRWRVTQSKLGVWIHGSNINNVLNQLELFTSALMVSLINKRKYRTKSDLRLNSPKNQVLKVNQKSMPRRFITIACNKIKMRLKCSKIGSAWLNLGFEVQRNKKTKVKTGLFPNNIPIASVGKVHLSLLRS